MGGWVVQFMRVLRHAAPFQAGMSATGYWLGLTAGRVVLGFVTPRIEEKLAILVSLHQMPKHCPASHYSCCTQMSMTSVLHSYLYQLSGRCSSHLRAHSQLLHLYYCCCTRWILSWPAISRRHCLCHQDSTTTFACGQHRLFGRI